ncbi:MAG: PepSY-associated TM helix domain-containing protein, partial [Methylococcaceae bacterium]|nr:PepSY-associated TM helix domain-containing protein [Methylococcaceae bacterium]
MLNLSLKNRRKLWLKVHLYLGLFAGAVFVIIGLTGSLLAFEYPLDEALNADLMTVSVYDNKTIMPLDEIVAAGLKAVPANGTVLNIDFPRHEQLAYALWFEQASGNPDFPTRHQIFINPYTAKVTGQRLLIDFDHIWRNPFKDFILRLHYTLALGEQGMMIVGFIGIGLF